MFANEILKKGVNFTRAFVTFIMPTNENYLARFEPGRTYHVYNKTINREPLFRCEENYHYFLKQYYSYVSPIADTYGWNLLPNHFHLMIKIKSLDEIKKYVSSLENQTKAQKEYLSKHDTHELCQSEFKRFFTSYAMAFNLMHKRTGNLFYRRLSGLKLRVPTNLPRH